MAMAESPKELTTKSVHEAELALVSCTIVFLDVSCSFIGAEGIPRIVKALEKNTTLKGINLLGNCLGDLGIERFSPFVARNATLVSLGLGGNEISKRGAENVAGALRNNTTLTSLSLESNRIGDAGAEILASILQNNSIMTYINLNWNGITARGAQRIGSALEHNSVLKSLHLCGNKVSDTGVQTVAESLEKNRSLSLINLKSNKIGDVGAEDLGKLLSKNTSLTALNLMKNRITDRGAENIAIGLENNSKHSIREVKLKDNPLQALYIQRVDAAIQKRQPSRPNVDAAVQLRSNVNVTHDAKLHRAEASGCSPAMMSISLGAEGVARVAKQKVGEVLQRVNEPRYHVCSLLLISFSSWRATLENSRLHDRIVVLESRLLLLGDQQEHAGFTTTSPSSDAALESIPEGDERDEDGGGCVPLNTTRLEITIDGHPGHIAGIELDPSNMEILRILSGWVQKHNAENPQSALCVGDVLEEINGDIDTEAMQDHLLDSNHLQIKIRRRHALHRDHRMKPLLDESY